ncbi:MAG: hypothetical protein II912_01470 [Clostridia bacterium]|nr:hypothetical protein [Clostridia bacterium]
MVYTKEQLREICFPLGGIGAGCIGLAGNGRLKDFEIFDRPDKGSMNGYTHIAVRAVKGGECVARVLNSDLQDSRMGQYGQSFGYGPDSRTMAGFPHFENAVFRGEFPYAFVSFENGGFPGEAGLKAFSPFIPLDDHDSSLPAALFAVRVVNTESEPVRYAVAFSCKNPCAGDTVNALAELGDSRTNEIFASGAAFYCEADKSSPDYAEMALVTDDPAARVQRYWYKGGWKDSIATFWNEFSSGGPLRDREEGDPHATVMREFVLAPGEVKTVRFALCWYHPNCVNYWNPLKDAEGRDVTWKNWYATQFDSALSVADYVMWNWADLDERTKAFHDALFSSTLDDAVKDAAASSLCVLRSATVKRLEDGSFYGFEGCNEKSGSCEGTCQHVWNYAYALPFLFPKLERSIRDLEFRYSTDENGRMEFRLKLPLGREYTPFRACVDGQMGAVIKTWREWKISGDTEWLRGVFPQVKKALEYAFHPDNPDRWDRDMDGVLEGRQHHTLDMELFGPSSWLEGFYLAALKAGGLMARELGENESASRYEELYEKGRRWTNENLFNGRYFCQKIDLEDERIPRLFDAMNYWNSETGEIKYQIGEGSSIDQMCAQWHADILGLGRLFDKDKTDAALKSMMTYNFMPSARFFANPWRLFCLNGEAGTLICAYPPGARKPKIPVPYCEETMHGFEYQFAGLLLAEGFYDDAMKVIRAVRDRYDGRWRNPYNEMECGSNYARSMAAWALIPISGGFTFDLSRGEIGFDPVTPGDFNCIWSLGTGWGTYEKTEDRSAVLLSEGTLKLKKLSLPYLKKPKKLLLDGKETPFAFENGSLLFAETEIRQSAVAVTEAF